MFLNNNLYRCPVVSKVELSTKSVVNRERLIVVTVRGTGRYVYVHFTSVNQVRLVNIHL